MKKLGFLLMILILGTTFSMAQNRGGQGQGNFDPERSAKKQTADLKKVLDLSGDQENKVYKILLKGTNKIAEMRKEMRNGDTSREDMRANFSMLRKNQSKEIKKVLTDDQYKKYEEYLKENRNQRGQGQGRGRG